jgi:hypothetical protein
MIFLIYYNLKRIITLRKIKKKRKSLKLIRIKARDIKMKDKELKKRIFLKFIRKVKEIMIKYWNKRIVYSYLKNK